MSKDKEKESAPKTPVKRAVCVRAVCFRGEVLSPGDEFPQSAKDILDAMLESGAVEMVEG
jgi:hypothetical protein